MRFRPVGRAVLRELFAGKHNGRVDTGTVGFDPVFGAIGGVIHRHNHAAVGKAPVVQVDVLRFQFAEVTVLVTMERTTDFGRCEDGFGSGRDKDASKRKERGGAERWMAHGGCSGKARLGFETGFMLTTITPLLFCV